MLRASIQRLTAAGVFSVLVVGAATASATLPAQAMAPKSPQASATEVSDGLSAEEVRQLLFVAGDVARLSRVPGGTTDLVLEKVLQELYRQNPGLDPNTAAKAIRSLRTAARLPSAASLLTQSRNEGILSVLHALDAPDRSNLAESALRTVAKEAIDAELPARTPGDKLPAAAELLPTLSTGGFDPPAVLRTSARMAVGDRSFGDARDALWEHESGQSIFDSTQALLDGHPQLAEALGDLIGPDGEPVPAATVDELFERFKKELEKVHTAADEAVAWIDPSRSPERLAGIETSSVPDEMLAASEDRAARLARLQATTSFLAGAVAPRAPRVGSDLEVIAGAWLDTARAIDANARAVAEAKASAEIEATLGGLLSLAGAAATKDIGGAATALISLVSGAIRPAVPTMDDFIFAEVQALRTEVGDFRAETGWRFVRVRETLDDLGKELQGIRKDVEGIAEAVHTTIRDIAQLQAGLDRMQEQLFSAIQAGAEQDLWTGWHTYLGLEPRLGRPTHDWEFASAEGLFRAYAVQHAGNAAFVPQGRSFLPDQVLSEIGPPTGPEDADYLRLFPEASLNLDPLGDDQLPNPRVWKVAAIAYEQLLKENPDYVSPGVRRELRAVAAPGRLIASTLAEIGRADPQAGRTGSILFNALLDYYSAQVEGLHTEIVAEEDRYLDELKGPARAKLADTPGDPATTPGLGETLLNRGREMLFGGPGRRFSPALDDRPDPMRPVAWAGLPSGPGPRDLDGRVPVWKPESNSDLPTGWARVCKLSKDERDDLRPLVWSNPNAKATDEFGRLQKSVEDAVFTLPAPALDAVSKIIPDDVLLARRLGAGNLDACVHPFYLEDTTTTSEENRRDLKHGGIQGKQRGYRRSERIARRTFALEVRWFLRRADDDTATPSIDESLPAHERDLNEAVAWTIQRLPKRNASPPDTRRRRDSSLAWQLLRGLGGRVASGKALARRTSPTGRFPTAGPRSTSRHS